MKQCTVCSSELQGNQTKYCSNNCKSKGHYDKIKEQQNSYHSQTLRALRRKLNYIEMLGGQCSVCGYNKNLAALEFNHVNPSDKSMPLDSRNLANTKEETLLEELDKCNLLCANCHREHHHKEMDIINVKSICALTPSRS